AEMTTQLEIAHRLGFTITDDGLTELVDRTFARLNALIRSLDTSPRSIRETPAHYQSPMPNPESHA
ncbi:MAG: four helix bundle protein, partial [Pseudomonadota bacterium]|nr:four helix bundle protein [Pseudomonadota bacterium]